MVIKILFLCLPQEKFDPDTWATFKEAAKYVIPTAEHHDGFALYDSKLTRWDAKDMGPKRDLIGDLAKAVRRQGIKFGVSNHRMEHWDFMYPTAATEHDLYDPEYADFMVPHRNLIKTKLPRWDRLPKKLWKARKLHKTKVFWKNGWHDAKK